MYQNLTKVKELWDENINSRKKKNLIHVNGDDLNKIKNMKKTTAQHGNEILIRNSGHLHFESENCCTERWRYGIIIVEEDLIEMKMRIRRSN